MLRGNELSNNKERVVVVVGGGLAGLCASIEAHRAGAKVILLEQEDIFGGNSAKASSGLNGVPTKAQKDAGIDDSVELFIADTRKSGRGRDQAELVDVLARDSADALAFLEREGNMTLSVVSLLGGHSRPRTHRSPSPRVSGRPANVGLFLVSSLLDKAKTLPRLQLKTGAKVVKFVVSSSRRVEGVVLEGGETIAADSVVLATGGFATDFDGLLKEHAPSVSHLPSTNARWRSSGNGIRMGRDVGAREALMESVQVHPTALVDPAKPQEKSLILAGEALRGNGAIMINAKGERFCNELDYRDKVSEAIFTHGSQLKLTAGPELSPVAAFMLLNAKQESLFPEAVQFYIARKLARRFASLQEFCNTYNVPYEAAEATFKRYAAACAAGKDDQFHRPSLDGGALRVDEPLVALIVTPAVHYTMGGLVIDTLSRVVHNASGKPIDGLFAAGEITGGLHGENRLGGNSLLECVVFGRIAGREAAKL